LKKINYCIKNIGIGKFNLFLFLFGVALGIVFVNVFKNSLLKEFYEFQNQFVSSLNTIDIEKFELFKLIMVNNFKSLVVLLFFSMTTFGIVYIVLFITYQGFKMGFLLWVFILRYGIKGFFLFILFHFPQCIVYIPLMFITIIKIYHLYKRMHSFPPPLKENKKKIIIEFLPFFLLVILAFLIGSYLEAYINVVIIKKVLS
jgi:stage II sporulation protein M